MTTAKVEGNSDLAVWLPRLSSVCPRSWKRPSSRRIRMAFVSASSSSTPVSMPTRSVPSARRQARRHVPDAPPSGGHCGRQVGLSSAGPHRLDADVLADGAQGGQYHPQRHHRRSTPSLQDRGGEQDWVTSLASAREQLAFKPVFKDSLTSKMERAIQGISGGRREHSHGAPANSPSPRTPKKPFYNGIHLDKMESFFDTVEGQLQRSAELDGQLEVTFTSPASNPGRALISRNGRRHDQVTTAMTLRHWPSSGLVAWCSASIWPSFLSLLELISTR